MIGRSKIATDRRVLLQGLNQSVTKLSRLRVIDLDFAGIKPPTKPLSEFSIRLRLPITLVELILSGAKHVLDLRQGGIANLLNLLWDLLFDLLARIVDHELEIIKLIALLR